MRPELSAMPVVPPVSFKNNVAFAGRPGPGTGETLTVAPRPDALVTLVKTPAQAPNQLDDAPSVFC